MECWRVVEAGLARPTASGTKAALVRRAMRDRASRTSGPVRAPVKAGFGGVLWTPEHVDGSGVQFAVGTGHLDGLSPRRKADQCDFTVGVDVNDANPRASDGRRGARCGTGRNSCDNLADDRLRGCAARRSRGWAEPAHMGLIDTRWALRFAVAFRAPAGGLNIGPVAFRG